MFKVFSPNISGEYSPEHLSERFLDRLADRIHSGLLSRASKSRNSYVITGKTENRLSFRSSGLWTGINVGLNNVSVQLDTSSRINPQVIYQVQYWVWTTYCVLLCLAIGVFLIASRYYFFPELFEKLWHKQSDIYYEFIFWAFLIFWGILWPWFLVAFHKKSIPKLLKHIFDEVNQSL